MSKLSKLDEPLAVEFIKIIRLRMRETKNEMRGHRKAGRRQELNACEKALSELWHVYRLAEIEINHHIYAAKNILEARAYGKNNISKHSFDAVKHLIHASPERIEALRLVLVEGKTYQAAAEQFGWSRQAIHKTLALFYEAMRKREGQIDNIYPPEQI